MSTRCVLIGAVGENLRYLTQSEGACPIKAMGPGDTPAAKMTALALAKFSELHALVRLAWLFFKSNPERARAESLGDPRSAESIALWQRLMLRQRTPR